MNILHSPMAEKHFDLGALLHPQIVICWFSSFSLFDDDDE